MLSLLCLALACSPLPAATAGSGGKVFLTQEEALELAFPKCSVDKTTHFLNKKELKRARKAAGEEFEAGVVRAYVAHDKDGNLVGTAYFDRHRVRTLPEVLMVVVDPRGRISRLEVLSFAEPQDFLPAAKWYGQFLGKSLNKDLELKKSIRHPAGATLTAVATTSAVRRVLALHYVLNPSPAPSSEANATASQP